MSNFPIVAFCHRPASGGVNRLPYPSQRNPRLGCPGLGSHAVHHPDGFLVGGQYAAASKETSSPLALWAYRY